jgi:hypothetical protein
MKLALAYMWGIHWLYYGEERNLLGRNIKVNFKCIQIQDFDDRETKSFTPKIHWILLDLLSNHQSFILLIGSYSRYKKKSLLEYSAYKIDLNGCILVPLKFEPKVLQ